MQVFICFLSFCELESFLFKVEKFVIITDYFKSCGLHMDAVFLSIDCGSSESYTDENGIEWTGDDAYIQNGDNKTVAYPSLVPYPMSTMRVFSTRKKNCYSIKVDEGERVLVRASFYYGNYDRKNSPPVFDLQFDGNFWTTVNTSLRSYDVLSYEAIYVVKRNFTSICVAQTKPGQLPFISNRGQELGD